MKALLAANPAWGTVPRSLGYMVRVRLLRSDNGIRVKIVRAPLLKVQFNPSGTVGRGPNAYWPTLMQESRMSSQKEQRGRIRGLKGSLIIRAAGEDKGGVV